MRAIDPQSIDHFILARLAKEGLKPRSEADRTTLIRRVSLDLTGLPPTPQEVDAFVADKSPNAYEKVVDRLLASPHYGERMAMHWLDAARYADTNGFQSDTERQMWPWRDWVIAAFNRNLPFDQFTIEQLAGDLLPKPTREQIVATGFNRNHTINGEGGRIVEEWLVETVIDRVETTGADLAGPDVRLLPLPRSQVRPDHAEGVLPVLRVLQFRGGERCARRLRRSRCDPHPAVIHVRCFSLPTPEQEAQIAKLEAAVKAAEQHVAEAQKRLPQLQKEWETKFSEQLGERSRSLAAARANRGEERRRRHLHPTGRWLISRPRKTNPANDIYTITAPLPAGELTGLRIEALPDTTLPNQSLGRAHNGNFVLTGVEAEITAASLPQQLSA